MSRGRRRRPRWLPRCFLAGLMLFCALLAGCGARVETVGDLAAALQRKGIVYEQSEPTTALDVPHANIAEAVRLRGEALDVELLRVGDQRTYNALVTAVKLGIALRGMNTGDADRPPVVGAAWHFPFIAVVRREPEPGRVVAAFQQVFPDAEAR